MHTIRVLIILLCLLAVILLLQTTRFKLAFRKNQVVSPTPPNYPSPTSEKLTPYASGTPVSHIPDELLQGFSYPKAAKVSSGDKQLVLRSTDDTDTITEWYKNTFTERGFRSNTFVKTNANGNILNKLAGSNGTVSIAVTIARKNNDQDTTISINTY